MKQCFVIQGFGKKTDYTDGRVLDLDASYEVIKEAVESSGVECVRADEIMHTGIIDVPMYERLLNADLVIADLSTNNVNAAFELGVRYALRPYTTIVLAEDKFKNPFDLGHIVIRRYTHLGENGVAFKEAKRLIAELKVAINSILSKPNTDSPVYTYLPDLKPPEMNPTHHHSRTVITPMPIADGMTSSVAEIVGADNPSAKVMLDSALDKINANDFMAASVLLEEVQKLRPKDSFVLQQLALATYKSQQPTEQAALEAALKILTELAPETSNNPETLGLWGAIHKRLWEENGEANDLEVSISAYERGFFLKQDHYNGINLAYLLNLRAVQSLKAGNRDDALDDFVFAKRIRKEVIRYASGLVQTLEDQTQRYWVIATLYEAAVGIADPKATVDWEAKAKSMSVPKWMQETREKQVAKLQQLLDQYATLIAT